MRTMHDALNVITQFTDFYHFPHRGISATGALH